MNVCKGLINNLIIRLKGKKVLSMVSPSAARFRTSNFPESGVSGIKRG
jgi:hypothetical protein